MDHETLVLPPGVTEEHVRLIRGSPAFISALGAVRNKGPFIRMSLLEVRDLVNYIRGDGRKPGPTDARRLDWLERMHTLHGSVEFLYVVDGHEAEIQRDGDVVSVHHGLTLRAAIDAAMKEGTK